MLMTCTPKDHVDCTTYHSILEGLRKVDQVTSLDIHQTRQRVELSKLSKNLIQQKREILVGVYIFDHPFCYFANNHIFPGFGASQPQQESNPQWFTAAIS